MRLSFFFGLLHLWVLYVLHTTYVGGGVRYRKNAPVVASGTAGDGERKLWGVRGANGDDESDGWAATPSAASAANVKARTCLEYALATRPPEERSEYFARYGDSDKDSEGKEEEGKKKGKGSKEEDDGGESDPKEDEEGGKRGLRTKKKDDAAGEVETASEEKGDKKSGSGNGKSKKDRKKAPAVEPPLLGRDEILQIKIMYGGKCTGRCSRVRNVVYPTNSTGSGSEDDPLLRWRLESDAGAEGEGSKAEGAESGVAVAREAKSKEQLAKDAEAVAAEKSGISVAGDGDPLSSPSYWSKPHYLFATSDALLRLDPKFRHLHNVTVVNVTLTERCLSTGRDDAPSTFVTKSAEILSQIYGMDSPIINQVMYGIRTVDGKYRDGYIKNAETLERWNWRASLQTSNDPLGPVDWILRKVGVLFLSLLSFFLITSVTCVIVRVLTSSGVVLMFPLFRLIRSMGLPGAASDRIIGMSYPWIGAPQQAMVRRRINPVDHMINSHLAKMFLYYLMYEACQAAWSMVLYGKSVPASMPVWIYGFAMMWEYFSMIFVRSALSAYFFPRMALLQFTLYHLYFHSVPYGYFDVALIPLFLFMVQTMAYTLLVLEVPASRRGVISAECPREVYNRLSWPEWSAGWPHEWTVFLPLNSRNAPLYDREVVDNGGGDAGRAVGRDEDEEASEGGGEAAGDDDTSDAGVAGGGASNGEDFAGTEESVPLGTDDAAEGGRWSSLQRRTVAAAMI
uniref:Uncharacterized protein n=1 Tax=Odontella aurita TaxID=265563 RepID=A0A7S4MZ70_9STRA